MGENPSLGAIFMSLEEAKKVKAKFNRKFNELRQKTRNGDKQAALDIIKTLTAENQALAALGYRTLSEDEDGRAGSLVPLTDEWIKEQHKRRRLEVENMFRNIGYTGKRLEQKVDDYFKGIF